MLAWGFVAGFAAGLGLVAVRERSLPRKIKTRLGQEESYPQIARAQEIVSIAFQHYPHHALAVAFNGGKDCLVVFYLVLAHCQQHGLPLPKMVYFEKDGDEFPEMIAFRENFCARHQVELQVVNGNYKIGLEELKQQWGVEAIFMGTRSTDPFAPEVPFARTTSGWPNLMRVCPILYFDYSTVWEFLRALGLEYCCLYDEGFTSLGPQSTTVKNAQLVDEARGLVLPAHVLKQPQSEREGRQPTPVL